MGGEKLSGMQIPRTVLRLVFEELHLRRACVPHTPHKKNEEQNCASDSGAYVIRTYQRVTMLEFAQEFWFGGPLEKWDRSCDTVSYVMENFWWHGGPRIRTPVTCSITMLTTTSLLAYCP